MLSPSSRREFLVGSSAALVAAQIGTAQALQEKPPVKIDCHLHCFAGKSDTRFPYHARAPYQPEAAATPEHLIECMKGAGISYAVVVHPEPYQDDHRYLEYCLNVGKGKLKGVALVFADRPGSLELLPDLAKRLDLIAVRVHAYAPDRLPPFDKPELRRLWQMATDLKLAVQIHLEPRYAPKLEPLIQEYANTRVIIDHMGRPFQGTPSEHAVVLKWARFPNTIMKLAAIPESTTYPHRDIQPVVRQITDAFGADRIICGGGFNASASGASYAAEFRRIQSFLGHLSSHDQNKILGENARTLFGFA